MYVPAVRVKVRAWVRVRVRARVRVRVKVKVRVRGRVRVRVRVRVSVLGKLWSYRALRRVLQSLAVPHRAGAARRRRSAPVAAIAALGADGALGPAVKRRVRACGEG